MTVLLALTLGAGLRRRDLVTVTGDHVTVDDHGVHVYVPASPSEPQRTVTVARSFEPEIITAGEFPGDGLPKSVEFPNPSDATVVIESINTISLEKLIELKIASGMTAPHRLKDLADVEALDRAKDE